MTPRKLSQLCDTLGLPLKRVEALLQEHPEVKQLDIGSIEERIAQLAAQFNVPRDSALYLVSTQAYYYLCTPLADISARVKLLANRLAVPECAVTKAASCVPSLLQREPEVMVRKVAQRATLLDADCLQALHAISRAPELLSHSPGVIRKRLSAINLITRAAPRLICRMVCAQPDVVFLSPRIINNKIKVLMAILSKAKR